MFSHLLSPAPTVPIGTAAIVPPFTVPPLVASRRRSIAATTIDSVALPFTATALAAIAAIAAVAAVAAVSAVSAVSALALLTGEMLVPQRHD